jgi:hypothetical protein
MRNIYSASSVKLVTHNHAVSNESRLCVTTKTTLMKRDGVPFSLFLTVRYICGYHALRKFRGARVWSDAMHRCPFVLSLRQQKGHAVAWSLRNCATSRKVASSRHDEVNEFYEFLWYFGRIRPWGLLSVNISQPCRPPMLVKRRAPILSEALESQKLYFDLHISHDTSSLVQFFLRIFRKQRVSKHKAMHCAKGRLPRSSVASLRLPVCGLPLCSGLFETEMGGSFQLSQFIASILLIINTRESSDSFHFCVFKTFLSKHIQNSKSTWVELSSGREIKKHLSIQYAKSRKVADSISDEVIRFVLPNPSSCTMALRLTQPLKWGPGNFLWGKERPALKANHLTAMYEQII